MTAELAGQESGGKCQIALKSLVDRYRTQTKAALAWGLSQSTVSLLLNGQRGSGASEALRVIAKAEGIATENILLPPPRRLQVIERTDDGQARFVYDLQDPHRMLKQLQHWFSDLPSETRMPRQVVKAVMRVLFDESFSTIHPPSREWGIVMQNAEGWDNATAPRKARSKGPR
jgi:hypothetical protein